MDLQFVAHPTSPERQVPGNTMPSNDESRGCNLSDVCTGRQPLASIKPSISSQGALPIWLMYTSSRFCKLASGGI